MIINTGSKQAGFILVTIMIFLIIITLLCTYMLQDSLIQIKMSNNFYYNDKLFYLAEAALIEAEKEVQKTGITTRTLSELDSKEDWLKYGKVVTLKGVHARFTSQRIQTVCYKEQEGKRWLDFFRITVWIFDQKTASSYLLQSTYTRITAKPEQDSNCIVKVAPTLGRQSWLQLH